MTAHHRPVRVQTFGCRLNAYESEVIRDRLQEGADPQRNTIIMNTCAVTGEAVRQARQAIRKARREDPDARIIVTGCAAQTEPETFAAMDEVSRVIGNADKFDPALYAAPSAVSDFGVGSSEKIVVNDIMSVRETASHMVDGLKDRARAFVQVQNGCDHRCTFCIIPYGRGNSRSVPMGEVVRQVGRLVENGYREVVLTGVDITSYGADLPQTPKLGKLVKTILARVPELPRLRLSSIDSIEADDDLMDALATEPRLMPHLHLSLQAGDDLILKRMKRRHLRADTIRFCQEVHAARSEIVFGADIIAGFPTETEDQFQRSLDIVDECGLTFLHVFPFSPRKGTPAARMPQLPGGIAKARARRLRDKGREAVARHLDGMIGRQVSILVERHHDGHAIGRCAQFTEVGIAGRHEPGSILAGCVTGHADGMLQAVPG